MTIGQYDTFANPQGCHIIRGALSSQVSEWEKFRGLTLKQMSCLSKECVKLLTCLWKLETDTPTQAAYF